MSRHMHFEIKLWIKNPGLLYDDVDSIKFVKRLVFLSIKLYTFHIKDSNL